MRLIQGKLDDLMRKNFEVCHFDEQKALQFRLNELSTTNESYWRQRSRILWLKEGDHNTAFFHRRASNRRCRNRIKGHTNASGQWTSTPGEVSEILLHYYESILRADTLEPEALNVVLDCLQPKVSEEMNFGLIAPYSDDEIKKALFQMHPSKSPGPDGMSPCFFQKFWNVVGHDVCCAIREVLTTGNVSQESNFTHLTLIPKIKEPKLPSDLRPIALCNVVYKIASKVLANRLKKILPHIISPLQSAFVPGFILPTRGIRQGDPLSPYLFILCAEGLSALISSSFQNGTIRGLTMAPSAPTIHHLLFADDSFLFGEASKSSVVFSGNVSLQNKNNLAAILGVQCVNEHGLYLGLPIHVGHNKKAIFAYLKERLSKKLISWRSKILSSGGKELLIKAVAQTLPNYVMTRDALPKSMCNELQ
ncbi:uncharacterized protein LOC133724409 [Rosa rugosa]|uniref:uncharacterized protein LOC133724409 n=1 Tax=Rosa rugosa TaxID=74645 RepID=UPI002B40440F|nr:uncharacterized protein LOC133724409 [Rosa rugosa]